MKNIFILLLTVFSFSSAQYTLTTGRIGGANHNGEFNTFKATIFSGKKSHTIHIQLPYDVPFPVYYFSEEKGVLILVHSFDGFMDVYSNDGKKIWSQNFFKEITPNYERTISCAIGKFSIAILTSDVTLPKAKVHKYLYNGAKHWEIELPYSLGMNISMSHDEQTIFAGSYYATEKGIQQSTACITSQGKILGAAKILFLKTAFSPDGKFVAFTSRDEIVLVSTASGIEIVRAGKENQSKIITDVCWDNEAIVVQEAAVEISAIEHFKYSNPIFTWYSKEMNKLRVEEMVGTTYQRSNLLQDKNGIKFIFDKSEKIFNK